MSNSCSSNNASYDVAFYEAFDEEEVKLRHYLPDSYNCFFTWKTIQECGHTTPPAPIISTRTQSIYPDAWINQLDGIITRSTGYDHVTDYFQQLGQTARAAYLPDYAARAVAEQALVLWSALLRNLNQQQSAFKTFYRDKLTGREIMNRTIAVLGVGRIGGQIVDIASGLSMKVIGVDLEPNLALTEKYRFSFTDLKKALTQADIAVCSMNLNEGNIGLLDYGMLKHMPPGGVFINIARGEISPAGDLLQLLEEGHLSGVALDVYDHEKPLASVLRDGKHSGDFPADIQDAIEAVMKLAECPNAILTPHNAFNTEESVDRKCLHTVQNLEHFFQHGDFLTPIQ